MDLDKYQDLANRTAAPITEAVVERFREYETDVMALLRSLRSYGERINSHKRYIYYGKRSPDMAEPVSHTLTIPLPVTPAVIRRVDALHAVIGIATELAELVECLSRPDFDDVNFAEELGDLLWYVARGVSADGKSLANVGWKNIAKLQARYPDRYSDQNAIERNLEAERKTLEG